MITLPQTSYRPSLSGLESINHCRMPASASPSIMMETPCDENVLIACRVRPLAEAEKQRKDQDVVNVPDEGAAVWVCYFIHKRILG